MNMKKSLIALAVASAFVAPAAMAEATVYGQMHLSIDMANDGATPSAKTNQLNSRTSHLGFKGAEDLGSGLSAVWQIESDIAADDGSGTSLGMRNTFLGLKSDSLGTVLAGNHDTPYKMATRNLDVFARTAADNRSDVGTGSKGMGAGHDIRVGNSLNYMSPSMGGVSIAAATVFGAEKAAANTTKGSAISLAGMYSMDNIYATLAYQTAKAGNIGTGDLAASGGTSIFGPFPGTAAVGDKATAVKVGGGFMTDVFTVNAVLENLTYKAALAGTNAKNTNIYLAGKFNIGSSDAVKLAFTKVGDTKSGGVTTSDGAKQIAVGYDHNLSKNTMVYALYTQVKNNVTGGTKPSDISLGMKHSF